MGILMDDLRSLAQAGLLPASPPRSDGFNTAGPVRIFFSRFGSAITIGLDWNISSALPSTNTCRTLFINIITLHNHVIVVV